MEQLICPACGHVEADLTLPDTPCPACGNASMEASPAEEVPSTEEAPLRYTYRAPDGPPGSHPGARHLTPVFTGSGGEYFRIWIVNVFLTVITGGIYLAWAKVRTRRYFYASTRIDGHPFDYLADPLGLFKGYVIITLGLGLYLLADYRLPPVSALIGVLFWMLIPLLIYKSLCFKARNSQWRGLRFRFRGTLKGSYVNYLVLPLLLPFTLGLLAPFWACRRQEYIFGNLCFGSTKGVFRGRTAEIWPIYLKAWGLFGVAIAGMMIFTALGITPVLAAGGDLASETGQLPAPLMPLIFTIYALLILAVLGVKHYLFVRLINYSWARATLGNVRFQSTLSVRRFLWIRLSNLLLIILSCGLLTPWARVRQTAYQLSCLTLVTRETLSAFTAGADQDVRAYGEAAADFFDFEFGL